MKKIVSGLKKILFLIVTFFGFIFSKVCAVSIPHSPPPETMYGVKVYTPPEIKILQLIRFVVIPIIFIIGMIKYFKKQSCTTRRKVITIIIVLLLVVMIWFGIGHIIQSLKDIY